MKIAALLLSIVSVLSVYAADTLEVVRIETPVVELTYHVRLRAPKNNDLKFSLYWNYAADSAGHRADIVVAPLSEADGAGRSVCRYKLYSLADSAGKALSEGEGLFTYSTRGVPAFSAVLSVDATGARLGLGSDECEIGFDVPYDKENPAALAFMRDVRTEVLNNLLIRSCRPPKRVSSFESVDSLIAHVEASDDVLEGLWVYLDRDIDRTRAALGATYRLATVADGQGGYDIVYLGGDSDYSYPWKPLDIKGKLIATPFIDHYNLEWVAADGRVLSRETNARFEAGRAVLALNFPLLKSSIRLSRWHRSL